MVSIGYGYSGQTKPSVEALDEWKHWRRLHPEMRRRIGALIIDSGYQLGVGECFRNPARVLSEFLRRHTRVTFRTSIYHDGYYWTLNAGELPSAKPFESYHLPCFNEAGNGVDVSGETGFCVAADMLNSNWLASKGAAHLAGFGLRWFGRSDPPHLQAFELPGSRAVWNTTFASLVRWRLPGDTPPPPRPIPPDPLEDDMTARIWGHPTYANRWLIGPSTIHLSPALAKSYKDAGVVEITEAHDQTLKTVLFQCGLSVSDLVKV